MGNMLEILMNSLSMAIDTSKTEQRKQHFYALWGVVFVIAFIVANVT